MGHAVTYSSSTYSIPDACLSIITTNLQFSLCNYVIGVSLDLLMLKMNDKAHV